MCVCAFVSVPVSVCVCVPKKIIYQCVYVSECVCVCAHASEMKVCQNVCF